MISVSKKFKENLNNGATLVNYADITLLDGTVLNLEPKDFMIGGCSLDDKTTTGKFSIGSAIGKTVSLILSNHDERFSDYDFYGAMFYLYVAMAFEDGSVEKVKKGKYYVITPSSPGDTITVSGVDSMHLFDKKYVATVAYPATLQTILSYACLDCGVNIGFSQFNNYNYVVQTAPEDCTYREVVSWVAQVAGYHARINNDDRLALVWYDTALLSSSGYSGGNYKQYDEETNINGGDFKDYTYNTVLSGGMFTDDRAQNVYGIKSITVGTDPIAITGVQVSYDDVEYLYGAEGYVIKVEKNPFTDGKEETVAKYLGNKLIGMTFRTFDASVLENPLYEPFDVVNAFDRKGNMYPTIINSVSYKIGGYTQISCKAESPVRNESSYTNEAANALVQAKKNTKKELTTYEKAVQSMNQLAMNAMGFYSSEEKLEDGSTIAYIHNKPNREESSTIYKMTSDGFFISQDGGKSYTAGFDSAGNAVLNILSAIGIQFDWAKGGILSLGGYDNVNGQIFIYNANGVQVGTINNNGIVFYSDESKRQIVISPVTGFYQRDSEGNEFYGLSYDATVHLPQYTPYVNGESRQSVVRVSRKDGIDDDIITSKYLYINQYSENGIEKSKYNIRATYEHSYAYWKTTETTEFYNKNKTTVKIQLPDSFKGKEWIVTLIYKGINIERKKDYKYLEYYYYNEKLPLCYEGEYLDSGEIIRLGWVTSIPGEFYTTETNLMLNRVGHTTTYLSLPEVTSGYANIQSSIGDEIKEYDYTYTTDEENGTITITGYATDGKYYINELMDIRVLVTC